MNLSIEDQFVFLLLKSHFNKKEDSLSDLFANPLFDWEQFSECVIRNGIGPFFYRNILSNKNISFPLIVNNKLKASYYKTLSRNVFLYEQFNNISTKFSENNISVIVLKGIFIGDKIYKDIGVRQLSDIDLLLKYQDIEAAGTILMRMGFENLNRKLKKDFHRSKHFNFQKNGVIVELHQHIYHYTERFNVDICKYWENAKPIKISKSETLILADIDLIQQLCIHLYIHIRVGKFSLISFCDIVTFMMIKDQDFDWDQLFSNCKQENCINEVANVLMITHKYIGEFIPKSSFDGISGYFNAVFEERFISIFQGNDLKLSVAEEKINAFRATRGVCGKINYFSHDIFQQKEFMIYRYNPKYPKLYFLYYPIRMFASLYKAIAFNGKILKKKSKK